MEIAPARPQGIHCPEPCVQYWPTPTESHSTPLPCMLLPYLHWNQKSFYCKSYTLRVQLLQLLIDNLRFTKHSDHIYGRNVFAHAGHVTQLNSSTFIAYVQHAHEIRLIQTPLHHCTIAMSQLHVMRQSSNQNTATPINDGMQHMSVQRIEQRFLPGNLTTSSRSALSTLATNPMSPLNTSFW